MPFLSPFYQITCPPIQRKYYICKVYEHEEKHKLKKVMSIKVRLIIMNFLQFFVWGSWLISLGGYMGRELHFEGG